MADDLPSNAQAKQAATFKLPEDLNTLSQMRDQLSDYLNTLERNTDSVNAWLSKNQNDIIVGLHRLNRALAKMLGRPEGFFIGSRTAMGSIDLIIAVRSLLTAS